MNRPNPGVGWREVIPQWKRLWSASTISESRSGGLPASVREASVFASCVATEVPGVCSAGCTAVRSYQEVDWNCWRHRRREGGVVFALRRVGR